MRLLSVVGTRPQFIKAAAVSWALRMQGGIEEKLVHTGQHFDDDMSAVFFDELGIPQPARKLCVHGGTHGDMTGRMLQALELCLIEERPHWVLVYGDTNSTLAGTLAAAKLNIPVAHVEAGLRSYNRRTPEEVNRVVTDHLSALLLCPTRGAVENLRQEGLSSGVHHVGDVMYDAALLAARHARMTSRILEELNLKPETYAVATLHRAETTDDLHRLAIALDWLKARSKEHGIVFPLHPRTRNAIDRGSLDITGLRIIPPLGYFDMTRLIECAVAVYTDSGGLQKEAYFHRKPCVTLRSETEWTETIEAGWNRLWTIETYKPRRPIDDYGDGQAGARIAALLAQAQH